MDGYAGQARVRHLIRCRSLVFASLEPLVPFPRIDGGELIAAFSRRYRDRSVRVQHVEQTRFRGVPFLSKHLGIRMLIAEMSLPEIRCEVHRDGVLGIEGLFELTVKRHSAFCGRDRDISFAFLLGRAGILDMQRKATAASEIEGHLAIVGIGQDIAVVRNHLMFPGTGNGSRREGYAGDGSQSRQPFQTPAHIASVVDRHTPRKRSIQYSRAVAINHGMLWNTGSPVEPGDDSRYFRRTAL